MYGRAAALACAVVCATPAAADAFCGFYVGGADAKLFNDATMVAMMRDGTRTVLSIQNNYKGPPNDFAMVVPVPVVLQKKQVKTLPREVFERLDQLAAPRLVEYWEQDPCRPYGYDRDEGMVVEDEAEPVSFGGSYRRHRKLKVKVEARFAVGEYDIVILGAGDSADLEEWLHREGYNIPKGAETVLRPYVAQGSKFFVAKVNAAKVHFQDGQAILSPLRFYYDSEQFNLPVRLGMINSEGRQDLIVHILARAQRYEVANYDNVTIPTNLELSEDAIGHFGGFYAALFDATLQAYPGAVVTEYAWDASSCDPCPTPALSPDEIATLGGDVVTEPGRGGFVLTRLHARYRKGDLSDDLVFRAAPPIVGGREFVRNGTELERGAVTDQINNFQGRYIVRHPWTGPIACEHPQRGIWGGPPGGGAQQIVADKGAAFAPTKETVKLASVLKRQVAPDDYSLSRGSGRVHFRQSGIQPHGCAGCATAGGGAGGALLLLALAFVVRRRRR